MILRTESKRRESAFAEGTRTTCTGKESTELGRIRISELLFVICDDSDPTESVRERRRVASAAGTDDDDGEAMGSVDSAVEKCDAHKFALTGIKSAVDGSEGRPEEGPA